MIATQLDLWQAEVMASPWQGRSPRGLTRARKFLFLRREPQKDDRKFVDQNQLDLFPAAIKLLPRSYGGAPLLVPLKARDRQGG